MKGGGGGGGQKYPKSVHVGVYAWRLFVNISTNVELLRYTIHLPHCDLDGNESPFRSCSHCVSIPKDGSSWQTFCVGDTSFGNTAAKVSTK